MSNYNADNMAGFLGSEATNKDAERFGAYLTSQGWTLEIPAGSETYRAYAADADGEWREMDESEWQDALSVVFP